MKYRVVIADDEAKIIHLIEELGRWEELGIEIVDTCSTGSAALASILRHRPDFVLSDIKMPGLDGLELIQKVRDEGVEPLFILISGYRHFEYARTAVSLNVMDYLLKPIDEEQLNETLARVCRRIDQQRSQQADAEEASRVRQTREREQMNRFFTELIYEKTRQGSCCLLSEESCNAQYMTRFRPGCYRVLFVFSNLSEILGSNSSVSSEKLEKCMKESFPPYIVACSVSTYKGTVIVLNYDAQHKREVRQAIDAFYYSVRNLREVFGSFRLHIGVSAAHTSIRELYDAADEAHIAEWGRLAVGKDEILEYAQVAALPVFPSEAILPAGERREIVDCIRYLRKEELNRLLEGVDRRVAAVIHHSPRGMMEAFFDLERDLLDALPEEERGALMERYYYAYVNSSHYQQLVRNLFLVLSAYIDDTLRKANEKKGKPIAMAVRLIREHYAEQLSLEEVAGQIHVSPKYLSRLFKDEMGIGFSEYLTQVRLEAAEKLLSSSVLNVRQIAAQVGYLDEKYFSRLFKKETGLKPTEYRRIYG